MKLGAHGKCIAQLVLLLVFGEGMALALPPPLQGPGAKDVDNSIALPAPQATAPLESVRGDWGRHRGYRDDRHGVSVTVVDRPLRDRKGNTWGESTGGVQVENDVRIAAHVIEDDFRTVTTRVPLTLETIRHLIQNDRAPVSARFVAVNHILDAGFDPQETARLLRSAVAVPSALVRYYAWMEAFDAGMDPAHRPPSEAALITPGLEKPAWLHRVLLDPCLDVAHYHLHVLVQEHDLRDAAGKPLEVTMRWRGSALRAYACFHGEVLAAALALNGTHPELISVDDLTVIRSRAIPSDDWFKQYSEGRWQETRELYVKEFLRRP